MHFKGVKTTHTWLPFDKNSVSEEDLEARRAEGVKKTLIGNGYGVRKKFGVETAPEPVAEATFAAFNFYAFSGDDDEDRKQIQKIHRQLLNQK